MAKQPAQPLSKEDACYLTEDSLARELSFFVTAAHSPVPCSGVASEFDYSSGRADLVGRDCTNDLHAFETKLTRWRKALEQARRNGNFAHFCYVALPSRAAGPALRAKDEFERHGVGLVIVNGQTATLAIKPTRKVPLLPWLTKVATEFVSKS